MKMCRSGNKRVHVWAGTQVAAMTGRSLWLDEREA